MCIHREESHITHVYMHTHTHTNIQRQRGREREKTKQKSETLIFLICVNVEIVNKILTNQIQEHIKTIYHEHDDFIPWMQDWSNTSN